MPFKVARLSIPLALAGAFLACTESNPNQGSGGAGAGSNMPSGGGGSGPSTGGGPETGGGGSGGGPETGGGGSGGTPSAGWTIVPLIDDKTDPQNPVFRPGNDLVTGIYFKSADDGWVTTTGSQQTFQNGGAIFKASQTAITKVLFSGNRDGLCQLGSIDFAGIDKSPDGFVALAYACDVIASHDSGATFDIQPALAGDSFGIESVLTLRSHGGGALLVSDSGYLAASATAPGPTAVWRTTWAPQASPTVPDPVPADECQDGPAALTPVQRTAVYVNDDASLIAYVAAPDAPQICISTDGGKSFFPKLLPDVPDDAQAFVPTGVVFANATTGITYWGNSVYPGLAYIYRTTDAGKTWRRVDLPADVADKSIELASAFFAPDAAHGWVVGFDYDASISLLLATTDGGATWSTSTSDLASKVSKAGGGKLFTGFALDADHVWVGGEHGILAANAAGGK